jgi:hypothetical protein
MFSSGLIGSRWLNLLGQRQHSAHTSSFPAGQDSTASPCGTAGRCQCSAQACKVLSAKWLRREDCPKQKSADIVAARTAGPACRGARPRGPAASSGRPSACSAPAGRRQQPHILSSGKDPPYHAACRSGCKARSCEELQMAKACCLCSSAGMSASSAARGLEMGAALRGVLKMPDATVFQHS